MAGVVVATIFLPARETLAARPRGPSPQQIKKMKEQMEWMQSEMQRFQQETAAVNQKLFQQFDENGNGRHEGAEKAKFNSYMSQVKKGKETNPYAEILPPGQGPKPKKK